MIYISPSLLSADMARLAEAIDLVKDAADFVHCDVMDGHFVPNLTFGAPVIAAIKKLNYIPLDVHLMIEEPGRWIQSFLDTGLDEKDYLTFHYEAESDPQSVIQRIRKAGVHPGISIKPGTSFETITELFPLVDMLLIMTVEPGFGNQKFMTEMLPKIKTAKQNSRPDQVIAVDGGINQETAKQAVCAGANLLVAGGAVYGQADPVASILAIRQAVSEHCLREDC